MVQLLLMVGIVLVVIGLAMLTVHLVRHDADQVRPDIFIIAIGLVGITAAGAAEYAFETEPVEIEYELAALEADDGYRRTFLYGRTTEEYEALVGFDEGTYRRVTWDAKMCMLHFSDDDPPHVKIKGFRFPHLGENVIKNRIDIFIPTDSLVNRFDPL